MSEVAGSTMQLRHGQDGQAFPLPNSDQEDENRVLMLFGTRVLVRVSSDETAGKYCVVETTFPAHYRQVLSHWHAEKSEIFYVMDGALTFTLSDQTFIAQRGNLVTVKPNTVHVYWNSTASPVTFLTLSAPGGLDFYLAELAETFADRSYDAHLAAEIALSYDQFSPQQR